MTQYLLSAHSVEGEARDPMTDEEMRRITEQVGILEEEMKSADAWVFGGRLHAPDTATVVRVSDGEVLTTDGPFAESKEHLGGFYIVEAEDLDAALAVRPPRPRAGCGLPRLQRRAEQPSRTGSLLRGDPAGADPGDAHAR
jgi:hypothetical protein